MKYALFFLLFLPVLAAAQTGSGSTYNKGQVDGMVSSLTALIGLKANTVTVTGLANRIAALETGNQGNVSAASGISYQRTITVVGRTHGEAITHGMGTQFNLPAGTKFTYLFIPAGGGGTYDTQVTGTPSGLNALILATPLTATGARETFSGDIKILTSL